MPIRLDTVLRKVEQMSNKVNSNLLKDFYQHMKDNGTSQNYPKGNLKAMIHFGEHISEATSFFDVDHKQVVRFLDIKIKPEDEWKTPSFLQQIKKKKTKGLPQCYSLSMAYLHCW